MRERERLDDFRGGYVACRGCKRLIFFHPGISEHTAPILCCGIAYVPTRHQIDLVIYDRLSPDELDQLGAEVIPAPGPVVIPPGDPNEVDDLPYRLPVGDPTEDAEEVTISEADVDSMLATAAQIAERRVERQAVLQRRGPGRPAGSVNRGPQYE